MGSLSCFTLYVLSHLIYIYLNFQDCFPARFAAIHFVNQPWYVEAVFKVIRPFLKDKTKEKVSHTYVMSLRQL